MYSVAWFGLVLLAAIQCSREDDYSYYYSLTASIFVYLFILYFGHLQNVCGGASPNLACPATTVTYFCHAHAARAMYTHGNACRDVHKTTKKPVATHRRIPSEHNG